MLSVAQGEPLTFAYLGNDAILSSEAGIYPMPLHQGTGLPGDPFIVGSALLIASGPGERLTFNANAPPGEYTGEARVVLESDRPQPGGAVCTLSYLFHLRIT